MKIYEEVANLYSWKKLLGDSALKATTSLSVSAIVCATVFIASLAFAKTETHTSPLDDPALLKKTISAVAGCAWNKKEWCPRPNEGFDITIGRSPDGTIAFVGFDSPRAEEYMDGPHVTDFIRTEQAVLLDTIAAIFPTWTDGREWMKDAVDKSVERMFHTSIRVNETSIYVRDHRYSDKEGRFTFVFLTKKKDLREFKDAVCDDDEQGPGVDDCTDRSDGSPRPPSSILLLK